MLALLVSPQRSTVNLLDSSSTFFIHMHFFFLSILLENYSAIGITFSSLETTEVKVFKVGQQLSREHNPNLESLCRFYK